MIYIWWLVPKEKLCFPENLDVSRDQIEGNIEIRGESKSSFFQKDQW